MEHSHQGLCSQGKRSGKSTVFVAFGAPKRRQPDPFQRTLQNRFADQYVSADRQMRAMLFGCTQPQNRHHLAARQCRKFHCGQRLPAMDSHQRARFLDRLFRQQLLPEETKMSKGETDYWSRALTSRLPEESSSQIGTNWPQISSEMTALL
jgi:hypothetical protein